MQFWVGVMLAEIRSERAWGAGVSTRRGESRGSKGIVTRNYGLLDEIGSNRINSFKEKIR